MNLQNIFKRDAIIHSCGSGLSATPKSKTQIKGLVFDNDDPLLSVISGIAPPPDYFDGVSSFEMRCESGNGWIETVQIDCRHTTPVPMLAGRTVRGPQQGQIR